MSARHQTSDLQQSFRWHTQSVVNSPEQCEPRLHDVEAGAQALNLSSDAVNLAAEIASFETHLTETERIALILLIMIALAASAEGSTRFPITGPLSIEPMRRLLSPLCGESFGADAVER